MSNHRRFFIEDSIVTGEQIKIVGNTAGQISSVLRLGTGDKITLFNGSGAEFESIITSMSQSCVCADVRTQTIPDTQLPYDIIAAIGRSKPAKVELIIQKCTELGVSQFIIVESAHSIGELPDDKKTARWRKIAIEAVEQCGGTKIPQIVTGTRISDLAVMISKMDAALLAHEQEKYVSLANILIDRQRQWDETEPQSEVSLSSRRIMLITGPEGGFRPDEVDTITMAGAISFSLGNRILRAETAVIAGCAAIVMHPWS